MQTKYFKNTSRVRIEISLIIDDKNNFIVFKKSVLFLSM